MGERPSAVLRTASNDELLEAQRVLIEELARRRLRSMFWHNPTALFWAFVFVLVFVGPFLTTFGYLPDDADALHFFGALLVVFFAVVEFAIARAWYRAMRLRRRLNSSVVPARHPKQTAHPSVAQGERPRMLR